MKVEKDKFLAIIPFLSFPSYDVIFLLGVRQNVHTVVSGVSIAEIIPQTSRRQVCVTVIYRCMCLGVSIAGIIPQTSRRQVCV